MVKLLFTILFIVDLAQYEIFRAKVCDFWQEWYKILILDGRRGWDVEFVSDPGHSLFKLLGLLVFHQNNCNF